MNRRKTGTSASRRSFMIEAVAPRFLSEGLSHMKACMPVCDRPKIKAWMSLVPS